MNCFSNKRIGIIVVSVLLLTAALFLFIIWEGSHIIDTSIPLTDERIAEVLDANSYTSPEQRTVVESAVSEGSAISGEANTTAWAKTPIGASPEP